MSDQTASTSPGRQRRARLLIVGEDPTTSELGDVLPVAPTRVGNLFEAIGALSSAEAMQPIAAVLIPEAMLPPAPQQALEALKRVDPSVRLIRVVGNGRSKDVPAIEGFDACLEAPITGDTVKRILSGTLTAAPAIGQVSTAAPPPDVPDIDSELEESPLPAAPAPPSPPSPPRGETQAKPEEAPPAVGEGKAIDEHPISAALRHRSRPAALPRRDPRAMA